MNDDEDNTKKRIRHIIEILIIIIIILLLITCCTSRFIGRIGIIVNDTEVDIDNDTDDKELILNKELKFYKDSISMSLSDEDVKLSYYFNKINPDKITCFTSDASIATCYVKDGYVVVKPKKTGNVNVYAEAYTNGKRYQAKSRVTRFCKYIFKL